MKLLLYFVLCYLSVILAKLCDGDFWPTFYTVIAGIWAFLGVAETVSERTKNDGTT